MKHTIARILVSGGTAAGILFSGTAAAIDFNFTGFVRQEIAYRISSTENPNNTWGNPFNGRITPLITYNGAVDGGNFFGAGTGPLGPNHLVPTTLYQSTPGANAFGGLGGLFSQGFAPGATASPVAQDAARMIGLPAGANTSTATDCHFAYRRALAAQAFGFGYRPQDMITPGPAGTLVGAFAANGFAGRCNPANGAVGSSIQALGNVGTDAYDDPDGAADDLTFNTFNTRAEFDIQARFNREFSAYMKIRAFFDAAPHFTDAEFDNQFKGNMWGTRSQITEWNSSDAIIDIPAFYVDWNRGPAWLRIGNQTIAWGEAYFFRTMDVANGLDLRRHLTLGPGAEEYQDQRVASPGVRFSYTFKNGWELDTFAQLWSPTILPEQDTPYNLVASWGAQLNDEDGMDDARGAWNYGLRLTMPLTDQFTGIVGWVNRRNPDGVFTGSDKQFIQHGSRQSTCINTFDDAISFFSNAPLAPAFNFNAGVPGSTFHMGIGPALNEFARRGIPVPFGHIGTRAAKHGCGNPFSGQDRGPHAIQAWQGVQTGRIDGLAATRNLINEFPMVKWQVRDVFGFGDEYTFADLYRTVDGFRNSYGPISANIQRFFKRENIFMVGGNYIVNASDPNSIWDQLIIRGEVAVTPNKRITNNLSFQFKEVDDVVSALILEKYHRFTDAFPATYMVFQWMHRTSTDLFGRDLDMMDTPDFSEFVNPVTGDFTAAAFVPGATDPRGVDNANYVVFAFQQPFPNLVWRFDMSILVDVAGGYLVQPGLRYRPSANWQWDLYATVIESPGGDNDTITESLDWADEVFVRLTYFF